MILLSLDSSNQGESNRKKIIEIQLLNTEIINLKVSVILFIIIPVGIIQVLYKSRVFYMTL